MAQQKAEQLLFRPASEKPTCEMDGKDVLLYNPCDGWHLGTVVVVEDEGGIEPPYIYIRDGIFGEFEPHTFYVAWAILPDYRFGEHFENQKGIHWSFENP